MHIIIDGYNLIRQSPSLRRHELKSLEEGRRALLEFLFPYAMKRPHRITVVFDGWREGDARLTREREKGIDIIYSPKGVTADEVIKDLTAHPGEEILVVTSDRDVAQYVERRGGTAVTSQEFESLLKEHLHRPQEKDYEDEEEEQRHKKKGPAHRLSRRERLYRKRISKL
jgi:predicted RNA-binding protein with PIN domain